MTGQKGKLIQINEDEVVYLPYNEDGYQSAKSILVAGSLDLTELSENGRERVRSFIKQYQRDNFAA